jgi:hypothetical protein
MQMIKDLLLTIHLACPGMDLALGLLTPLEITMDHRPDIVLLLVQAMPGLYQGLRPLLGAVSPLEDRTIDLEETIETILQHVLLNGMAGMFQTLMLDRVVQMEGAMSEDKRSLTGWRQRGRIYFLSFRDSIAGLLHLANTRQQSMRFKQCLQSPSPSKLSFPFFSPPTAIRAFNPSVASTSAKSSADRLCRLFLRFSILA